MASSSSCTTYCSATIYSGNTSLPLTPSSDGVLAVVLRHRYRLYVQTGDSSLVEIEDITTPELSYAYEFPADVLALPESMEEFVSDVLEDLKLDERTCDNLRPKIESLLYEASESEADEMNKVVVVARVDTTRIEVVDYEKSQEWFNNC